MSDILGDPVKSRPPLKWRLWMLSRARAPSGSLREPLGALLWVGRSTGGIGTRCRESCQGASSGIQLFSRPLCAAFLTVETTASLFGSIIEIFCVYVLCWRPIIWSSLIFELLALKKKKEVIIKFGVDIDIGLCFYQQIIAEEINVPLMCVFTKFTIG